MGADETLQVGVDRALFLSLIELAGAAAAGGTRTKIARLAQQVLGRCPSEQFGKQCQDHDGHPDRHSFVQDGRLSLTWEDS